MDDEPVVSEAWREERSLFALRELIAAQRAMLQKWRVWARQAERGCLPNRYPSLGERMLKLVEATNKVLD